MRLPNTDLNSINNAERLPEGETMTFEITSVRAEQPTDDFVATGGSIDEWEPTWAFATAEVVGVDNPDIPAEDLVGRRVDMNLISARWGPRNLFTLVKHKAKYDPDEGWDEGIPRDENGEQKLENLIGVTFKGRVRGYTTGKGDYKQEVKPLSY